VLVATVDRYNASAAGGEDVDYLKDPKFLQPIRRGPFYGAEVRPATVCFTACGLRIDRDAAVLGESGRAIEGLFAAGESVGGVIGPRYVGSGNSYANCVTYGRIAGTSAARISQNLTGAGSNG
jgi:fumarate reductase flavoprotein subunit